MPRQRKRKRWFHSTNRCMVGNGTIASVVRPITGIDDSYNHGYHWW
ncbi:hypothetical protein BIFANG_02832 [Bifidobacterium angulatum DSM 20098 = JCM 7096]|uniref:Uncharacterized protein n=1 Tax=Bifidobacterium angulatum DSM 20098 = JCM 7096 TaxID=518635 RepID=C4FEU1_9BIFI|nr:hypothetical protein BIFANG_02832 [Bifidobacterium angulatum DSM 20098 = JCM 7096]